MCGRAYQTYTDEELEARYLNERAKRTPLGRKPNYNLAPTQLSPVVLVRKGEVQLDLFRWGLIPLWAKDVKSASKYSLINAKGEEIETKRSYKTPFEKRRCIVPLSGFIEWKRPESGPKRPYAIHLKSESILSAAAVWEKWQENKGDNGDESEKPIYSFSIVTTSANSFMAKIHDRMPVILSKKDEAQWLDPDFHNIEALKKLLKPCAPSLLSAHEISSLINSPRNNRPEVLEKIDLK